MISGLEKAWSVLKNFKSITNVLDDISSDICKLNDDEITTTSKRLEINSMENDAHQLNDFIVQANESGDKVQWQDMMIKGPSPYSSMRKTFSDILIELSKNSTKLSVSSPDGKCNVTIGNDGLGINGERKIGIISPCVRYESGRNNTLGLKIEPHESVSLGIGVNFMPDGRSSGWSSTTFQNTAVVLETNAEFTGQVPTVVKANVSGVFGRGFGRIGILAGFDLALSNSDEFHRREIFRSVSLGVVSPTSTGVLTIQPKNELLILENGWKIINSLELATRSKTKYTLPTWNSRDHEVGLKYKHSEDEEYGVQMDLAGNLTLRLCLSNPYWKSIFIAKADVEQRINSYGIAIEI